MKLINMTENNFREFANINSYNNFGQSTEYSKLIRNADKRKLFFGLMNDNDDVIAASLILIRHVSPIINIAIAPNGYIIDYNNHELVETFTNMLKERLLKEKVLYLITNPMFKYKVYNKYGVITENNEEAYNNLLANHYKSLGYYSEFEHYDVILDSNDSIEDIYKGFDRNTKRNIKDAMKLGVSIYKGNVGDLNEFYQIVKKKTPKKLSFYKDIMTNYQNNDNMAEIYFAKLNTETYLINIKKLYEQVEINNQRINAAFNKNTRKDKNHQLNRKITADKTLDKCKNALNDAIRLNQAYNGDIIIATCMIIKNNHEIYFLADGYKEEYRYIHATDILKWAIIRKYHALGYHRFNLGEVHKDYADKTSKYYRQYKAKIGFGGKVVEYTPNLTYIVNKPLYKLYKKKNHKN